ASTMSSTTSKLSMAVTFPEMVKASLTIVKSAGSIPTTRTSHVRYWSMSRHAKRARMTRCASRRHAEEEVLRHLDLCGANLKVERWQRDLFRIISRELLRALGLVVRIKGN